MATQRNKRKLATVSRDTQESARNCQSQSTFVQGMNEEYIIQVFMEIERRVTKKLSQEFSRTDSRFLGALSKLDEFLLNPQVQTCSGTVPGTCRNNNSENREPTGHRSLKDPYPEVQYSVHQASTSVDSDMVRGVQEEILYCSRGTYSGKKEGTFHKSATISQW